MFLDQDSEYQSNCRIFSLVAPGALVPDLARLALHHVTRRCKHQGKDAKLKESSTAAELNLATFVSRARGGCVGSQYWDPMIGATRRSCTPFSESCQPDSHADTDFPILRPFRAPIYVPRFFANTFWTCLAALRIVPTENPPSLDAKHTLRKVGICFVRISVPINCVTAPLMASLFLLALGAIGRDDIHAGIIGNDETASLRTT